jgi:hypothetical protein
MINTNMSLARFADQMPPTQASANDSDKYNQKHKKRMPRADNDAECLVAERKPK